MELIKVTEQNGEQLVSARELHAFLEIKSKFADWIKNRIEKYGFEEKQDFITLSKNLENGGREIDYILKLDMAKVFEVGITDIVAKYNIIADSERVKLEY